MCDSQTCPKELRGTGFASDDSLADYAALGSSPAWNNIYRLMIGNSRQFILQDVNTNVWNRARRRIPLLAF